MTDHELRLPGTPGNHLDTTPDDVLANGGEMDIRILAPGVRFISAGRYPGRLGYMLKPITNGVLHKPLLCDTCGEPIEDNTYAWQHAVYRPAQNSDGQYVVLTARSAWHKGCAEAAPVKVPSILDMLRDEADRD